MKPASIKWKRSATACFALLIVAFLIAAVSASGHGDAPTVSRPPVDEATGCRTPPEASFRETRRSRYGSGGVVPRTSAQEQAEVSATAAANASAICEANTQARLRKQLGFSQEAEDVVIEFKRQYDADKGSVWRTYETAVVLDPCHQDYLTRRCAHVFKATSPDASHVATIHATKCDIVFTAKVAPVSAKKARKAQADAPAPCANEQPVPPPEASAMQFMEMISHHFPQMLQTLPQAAPVATASQSAQSTADDSRPRTLADLQARQRKRAAEELADRELLQSLQPDNGMKCDSAGVPVCNVCGSGNNTPGIPLNKIYKGLALYPPGNALPLTEADVTIQVFSDMLERPMLKKHWKASLGRYVVCSAHCNQQPTTPLQKVAKHACGVCVSGKATVTDKSTNNCVKVTACDDCVSPGKGKASGTGTTSMYRAMLSIQTMYTVEFPSFSITVQVCGSKESPEYAYNGNSFKADIAMFMTIKVHATGRSHEFWVIHEVDGVGHSTPAQHAKDVISVLKGFEHVLTGLEPVPGTERKVLVIRTELDIPGSSHYANSSMVAMHVRNYLNLCIKEVAYGGGLVPRMHALYIRKPKVHGGMTQSVPFLLASHNLATAADFVPEAKTSPTPDGKRCIAPHPTWLLMQVATLVNDPDSRNKTNHKKILNPITDGSFTPWQTMKCPFSGLSTPKMISAASMAKAYEDCSTGLTDDDKKAVKACKDLWACTTPPFMAHPVRDRRR